MQRVTSICEYLFVVEENEVATVLNVKRGGRVPGPDGIQVPADISKGKSEILFKIPANLSDEERAGI